MTKCNRRFCKVCIRDLDKKVEYLWKQGKSLRQISREFNWSISHMTVKRHLIAVGLYYINKENKNHSQVLQKNRVETLR
ncbi:hypothetical protein DRP07_12655, partial [Archaeoglobales archaeon]